MLNEVGVECEVVVTTHAGHARFCILRKIISLLCFAFIFVHSCTVVHCRELVSSCDVSNYGGVVTVSGALKMSLSLLVNLISPTLRGRRFA